MKELMVRASANEAEVSGVNDASKPTTTAIPPFVFTERDYKKLMRLNSQPKRDGVIRLALRRWFDEIPASDGPAAADPKMEFHAKTVSKRRFQASLTYKTIDGRETYWSLTDI